MVMTGDRERPAPAGELAGPLAETNRIVSLDVLRGVAVLGILAMNVVAMGLPFAAYANPTVAGGAGGVNLAAWFVNAVLFDGKMRAIFSMLFGAGVVLMADRARSLGREDRLAGIHVRRNVWLIVFGLAHAYLLLWPGDILFGYGVCGLLLYLLRNASAKRLILAGCLVLAVLTPIRLGDLAFARWAIPKVEAARAVLAAGGTPTGEQARAKELWEGMSAFFHPDEEQVREEIETMRSGYGAIFRRLARLAFVFQTTLMAGFLVWDTGGMMLLGMALMRLGVFTAARSTRFYVRLTALGYGIGLPLAGALAAGAVAGDFDPVRMRLLSLGYDLNRIAVAMGHTGAVLLLCRAAATVAPFVRRWTARLAAVGRMALSNYIGQTILGTLFFYGYGLGLFGRLERAALWIVVVAIWCVQLAVCPIWLRRFRFGPLEWLWRSLTYGRPQPMRIRRS